MRHMVRIALAVMVASLLTGVTLRADDDDDDRDDNRHEHRNELRIRKRQVVVFNVIPSCDADPSSSDTIMVTGRNFGTLDPHVTLKLIELDVVSLDVSDPDIDVAVVTLPAAFCNEPATYLLTVMRTRMRHRHRWLKHTKKDLALFEVAIGAATLQDITDELEDHADNESAHHDPFTAVDAENVAQGLVGTHAGDDSAHHLPFTSADAIAAVAGIGLAGVGFDDDVNALIEEHAGIDDVHHDPEDGGAGGGGLQGYEVVSKTYDLAFGNLAPAAVNANGSDTGFPVLQATCSAGNKVLGGTAKLTQGFFLTRGPAAIVPDGLGPPVFISGQRPFGAGGVNNQWIAELFNPGTKRRFVDITVFAICATVAP